MRTAEVFNYQGGDQSYKALARATDTQNRAFFDTYFVRPPLPEWIFVNSQHERLVQKNLHASDAFSQLGAHAEAMQTAYAAAMTPKVGPVPTNDAYDRYKKSFENLQTADSAEAQRLLEMNRKGIMVYADGRNQSGMDQIAGETLFARFLSETSNFVSSPSPKPHVKARVLGEEHLVSF